MPKQSSKKREAKLPTPYPRSAVESSSLSQKDGGGFLVADFAVTDDPSKSFSVVATWLEPSAAVDHGQHDTSESKMEPALSAKQPQEASDNRQASLEMEEADRDTVGEERIPSSLDEDTSYDHSTQQQSSLPKVQELPTESLPEHTAECNMHDASNLDTEDKKEEAPTPDDIDKAVTPSTDETWGTSGMWNDQRSEQLIDNVEGNPIVIDDRNDGDIGGPVQCRRMSPRQNKGKRVQKEDIMPWTDTATFYNDSNDSNLLSSRWDAVQTQWKNLDFLRSIQTRGIRKSAKMFGKQLEAASEVTKEGEPPQACARDLMSAWSAVESECLILLDSAALKLFRSDTPSSGQKLRWSKKQRTHVTTFSRVLKNFCDQEKVVEGIGEFLEDQGRRGRRGER